MAPDLFRKLYFHAKAARRLVAIAKAKDLSFFSVFFADSLSVFGQREDQDKYEIFTRLREVRSLAPYLANTILFSPPYALSAGDLPTAIVFPVVVKPIWGAQSAGIVGVRDAKTLQRLLRARRSPYIFQKLIRGALEISVSYTRDPAGASDFFGVAAKRPVRWTENWRDGRCRIPRYFDYQDLTHDIAREHFLKVCRDIAQALRTNTFRFDAFIREENGKLLTNSLQIIDVNPGVFASDEFLFDKRHGTEFVVEQLVRRYTYLLSWGANYAQHRAHLKLQKLILHYLYCYGVVLYRQFSETPLISKFRGAGFGIVDLFAATKTTSEHTNRSAQRKII